MSSRLPAPTSRLQGPQQSRLQAPRALKRQASGYHINASPEKRYRPSSANSSSNESLDAVPVQAVRPSATRGMSRPRAPPAQELKRSKSMASIANKSGLSRQKVMGSTVDLTGRPSNITAASALQRTAVTNGTVIRRPGANITNRMNNTRGTAVPTKTPVAKAPVPDDKSGDGDLKPKGKPKRAAWDLKGRLQDMEQLVKSSAVDREQLLSKLTNYDQRIENLELEKRSLNQNLQQTQTVSQAHQEEVDRLTNDLRLVRDEHCADKRRLENSIRDLEFSKSSLERHIKSLESELSSQHDELTGLRSTVSHMSSAKAGLEAQLSSTKLMFEDRSRRVSELEAQVAQQSSTIEDLEQRLREGEVIRRKLHNTVQELKGNIRVFCRVRPFVGEEIKNNGDTDVIHHINFIDERTLEVCKNGDPNGSSMSGLKGRGNGTFEFCYDKVFNPSSSQAVVFDEISQLVQSALDGYNVCVFAYGQTGSGKTFTMEGVHGDEDLEGMIPRTVKYIFASMKQLEEKGWNYTVEASFLEIYNESIRDLLASPREAKNLTYDIKLVDSKKNDSFVTNLKIVPVEEETHVHHLLNLAQQQRAVAATNMNERSSRSHSVFRLKLTGVNSKTSESCEGTLNLVDLAGSERLKESGSEGARLTETQNINKSLANLGNVIMALGQKQSHVPYRNSKLTHLLQSSLGGNSKTLMFVNISPLDTCFSESLNSLRFATKVNQCHIGTASKQVRK